MMKKFKNHSTTDSAFTLAEVLITLSIIGIVAVLTIPNLVQNYEERARVTQLKKFYVSMQQAFDMAIIRYGTLDKWGMIASVSLDDDGENEEEYAESMQSIDEFWSKVLPYLRVTQRHNWSDTTSGATFAIYNLGGITEQGKTYREYIVLADGTAIAATWINTHSMCTEHLGTSVDLQNTCGDFKVDLNGKKGPNRSGIDVFQFWITKYGIYPMGTRDVDPLMSTNACTFENLCTGTSNYIKDGYGCTAWVIENGNMDYLHCRDELSWEGKHKCGE